MATQAGPRRLNVLNPGFDRDGVSSPAHPAREALYLRHTAQGFLREDWWLRLPWWESPLGAEEGIRAICARPFLHIVSADGRETYVPTQRLYPGALQATDDPRIEQAARSVAAYMRQGRELYMAAESAGVTDLSRPILYYYGALAYAKAATMTLFGADAFHDRNRHGLSAHTGPTTNHRDGTSWPTIIKWHEQGVFSRFYQAARWDEVWQKRAKLATSHSPQLHVLECIRYLGGEWGTLRPTGFDRPRYATTAEQPRYPREQCLLAYQPGQTMFMTHETSPSASVFQLPMVLVRFMLLYYFSMVARYHAAEWQELLGGATEPEGQVFRFAFEDAAHYFVREIVELLPYPDERNVQPPEEVLPPDPSPPDWLLNWYQWPEEPSDTPST
jgi:hypothetical protein